MYKKHSFTFSQLLSVCQLQDILINAVTMYYTHIWASGHVSYLTVVQSERVELWTAAPFTEDITH